MAIVLTRLRTDPTDPWRSDPEPTLVRSFSLDAPRQFDADVTLRLDPERRRRMRSQRCSRRRTRPRTGRSADRQPPPRRVGRGPRGCSSSTATRTTAWVTPFDGAIGATLTFTTTEPLQTFDLLQPSGQFSPITMVRLDSGSTSIDVPVAAPDARGRSTITLPTPLDAGPTSLTITGVEARTTVDRRYGDVAHPSCGDRRACPCPAIHRSVDRCRRAGQLRVRRRSAERRRRTGRVVVLDDRCLAPRRRADQRRALRRTDRVRRRRPRCRLGRRPHPARCRRITVDRVVLRDSVDADPAAAQSTPIERDRRTQRPTGADSRRRGAVPTVAGSCSVRATTRRGRHRSTAPTSATPNSSTAASTGGGSLPASSP